MRSVKPSPAVCVSTILCVWRDKSTRRCAERPCGSECLQTPWQFLCVQHFGVANVAQYCLVHWISSCRRSVSHTFSPRNYFLSRRDYHSTELHIRIAVTLFSWFVCSAEEDRENGRRKRRRSTLTWRDSIATLYFRNGTMVEKTKRNGENNAGSARRDGKWSHVIKNEEKRKGELTLLKFLCPPRMFIVTRLDCPFRTWPKIDQ